MDHKAVPRFAACGFPQANSGQGAISTGLSDMLSHIANPVTLPTFAMQRLLDSRVPLFRTELGTRDLPGP
jgi:hypothetical protein